MSRSSKAVTPDAVTTMMRGDSLPPAPSVSGSSFARRWFRDALAMDDMDAVDAPGSVGALGALGALRPQ